MERRIQKMHRDGKAVTVCRCFDFIVSDVEHDGVVPFPISSGGIVSSADFHGTVSAHP